jgi:hypothetical protein
LAAAAPRDEPLRVMDPATFFDATITSPEYVSRYGDRMLHND